MTLRIEECELFVTRVAAFDVLACSNGWRSKHVMAPAETSLSGSSFQKSSDDYINHNLIVLLFLLMSAAVI